MFFGKTFHVFVVDVAIFGDAVADEIINLGAASDGGTVSEVTTSWQRHGKNSIAGLAPSEVGGFVGVGTRMRLNVGVVGLEQLFCTVDSDLLDLVDVLVAAVVAFAGVALTVFISEDRAHGS